MTELERRGSRTLTDHEILEALPRAVVLTTPDGVILRWNEAADRLFGWSERDVLGRSVLDVLAPVQERQENETRLASVAAGIADGGRRTVRCRDGRLIAIATSTCRIVDHDGNVVAIVGTSEDVSAAALAEERTNELAEHLRVALEAGGLGTWRWNLATNAVAWDERLEAIFGFEPGTFPGTFDAWVSRIHPDDQAGVLDTLQEAMYSRSAYRVEHRVVRPNGSVCWIAGAGKVTLDEHGDVNGSVGCAADVTERATQEQEQARLVALANEAVERERVQRERLEFLADINEALITAVSVHDVMVEVTQKAVPRLGDWCSIHVLPSRDAVIPDVEIAHTDPGMVAYARRLMDRFPYDPDASSGLPRVIRTGATLFYPEIDNDVLMALDATDEERAIVSQLALRSTIVVPLVKADRVLGAIQFVMSDASRRYTYDDVVLAQTVAGRVASSLENRRLDEKQRLIAQTLQRSLLPASLPAVPGVEFAVRYWAAGEGTEVGGDFYDVFPLDSGHEWAVVIGDVCGKGPQAAALTGLARHSIRDSAWHGDSPVEVLASLNRAVRRGETDSFLTAVYATIDTSGSNVTLSVTCGGHPLPVRATTTSAATIGTPGSLLGVFEPGEFHTVTTALRAGEVIVFYTDGATDLPPPHSLSEAAFTELVGTATARGGTAEAIAVRIQRALETVASFGDRNDDVALLVLRAVPDNQS